MAVRISYKNIPVFYFAINRGILQVYANLFAIWRRSHKKIWAF